MICPNCGRYLEDGVAFCIYCGQRFGKYASDESVDDSAFDDAGHAHETAATSPLADDRADSLEKPGVSGADPSVSDAPFPGDAVKAPVAPANAQEGMPDTQAAHGSRPSVHGRAGSRPSVADRGRRLHADDEIARRMGNLDEKAPGRTRKVVAGVIIAIIIAAALALCARAFLPGLMGDGGQGRSSSVQMLPDSSSASSSTSSTSSSSSSKSSSKSSSSSKKSDSSSTTARRGATLERANNGDAETQAEKAAEAQTVEANPTSGEETTTGVVNQKTVSTSSKGFASPSVSATSVSPTEGTVSHAPELVSDGRAETAWNTNENGVGQSITLRVDSATTISALRIMNGYNKISDTGVDLYYANARAKKILVEYEGGSKTFTLKDKKGKYQKLKLGSSVTTSWVRITIKSVYAGSKYDDCCISEIEVK